MGWLALETLGKTLLKPLCSLLGLVCLGLGLPFFVLFCFFDTWQALQHWWLV